MTLDELAEKYGHVKLELDPHAVARMCSGISGQALEIARKHQARAAELEAILSRVAEWAHAFGDELKPKRADTYGEGVRDSKERVARILAAADTSCLAPKEGA